MLCQPGSSSHPSCRPQRWGDTGPGRPAAAGLGVAHTGPDSPGWSRWTGRGPEGWWPTWTCRGRHQHTDTASSVWMKPWIMCELWLSGSVFHTFYVQVFFFKFSVRMEFEASSSLKTHMKLETKPTSGSVFSRLKSSLCFCFFRGRFRVTVD